MLEEMIKVIVERSGLSEEEVRRRIKEKQEELQHLVSEEGAAYIVAKELGIELKKKENVTKLSEIENGNVTLIARVVKVFPVHEFDTEKAKGKVQNFIIADESGEARLSLWNEEIEEYDLKENDLIKIRGYAKKSEKGVEIRVGNYGIIQKLEEGGYKRKRISELNPNELAEIRAAIVHVFDFQPYFEVCPICNAVLKNKRCEKHGEVEPKKELVISAIVDDGFGNIRAVFFRDRAERIRKHESNDVLKDVAKGKEFILRGRCRVNKLFNRLEFVVDEVEEVKVEKEIETMLKTIELRNAGRVPNF